MRSPKELLKEEIEKLYAEMARINNVKNPCRDPVNYAKFEADRKWDIEKIDAAIVEYNTSITVLNAFRKSIS